MLWFDWMTLGVVVGVTIAQIVRGTKAGGMGLPMFEAAGLVLAAVVATKLTPPLAQALNLGTPILMLVIFAVLTIGAFILGRVLYNVTQWNFGALDGFLSFLFGLVAAWTIAHMVLRIIMEFQGGMGGEVGSAMDNAPIAREVFQFRGWNWLMQLLFRVKLGPDVDPDIG
jgi:uncharacterized membrane protein required for colicin V production